MKTRKSQPPPLLQLHNYTGAARDIVQKHRATRVDIKHDSQHGSFCLKMLQVMSIKKLKNSLKSNFF